MAYNFSQFKQGAEGALEWLKNEYAGLRTGKASPAILDNVLVEAYGSKMKIKELANVNLEDARSIRIVPWDTAVAKSLEAAIRDGGLGLSVSVDDKGLRVSFPPLTSERRADLVKVAKQKMEEARIRVRTEREKIHSHVDKEEKGGTMSKDDAYRTKQELQKLVDEANKKLEEIGEKKEKEILE